MSTPDPGPPNTTMEAPVQQQDSLRDIPAILKKLKHVREALEALEADDSARPQPASGARNGTADKPRSPSKAENLEPDDPMRDTIISPKVFGLSRFKDDGGQHRDSERPQHRATDKYEDETKYPTDKHHHELDEEARVWRVYLEEARTFDQDIVIQASESLELLLVFAGLFSAVLTTFVAQTSQSLSPDAAAQSAGALVELIQLVRAIGSQTPVNDVRPSASVASGAVSNSIVWVNGLWFVSLTLSLSTAIFAVLAKQWTRQYILPITGSSRERCFIRQFRYDGLEKWYFTAIIGLLPIPLHLSLIIFLVGLVIFLAPLHTAIAIAVGILSSILLGLYLATIFLPLRYLECPFRTPFSDVLYHATIYIPIPWQDIRHQLPTLWKRVRETFVDLWKGRQRIAVRLWRRSLRLPAFLRERAQSLGVHLQSLPGLLRRHMQSVSQQSRDADLNDNTARKQVDRIPRSLRDLERRGALKTFDNASIISSLRWLFDATSHRSVKSIIQQSFGTLPFWASLKERYNMQKCFFDEKNLQLTEKINVNLTEAEIDANLRMLRSYFTVQLGCNTTTGAYYTKDVNEAIVCLLADIPVFLNIQRVELEDCLEKAFSNANKPLSLPVCAWIQLYVANKRDNRHFGVLQDVDVVIQLYHEIYAKAKDSLDAGNAQKVILNALLSLDGTKVSPFAVLTPRAFLLRAGIDVFDTLHIGPEKRWVYTYRDHELEAPVRFLLDMNQYFVITLSTDSGSQLNESHIKGLWKMLRAIRGTSVAEDRAICAAMHKTLEMIIETEGPDEGLQLYSRFAGALHEMLEIYTRVSRQHYKPLSPVTSLLLRLAARCDRYHKFLLIGIESNDPDAYELFMNAIPDAPTSQDENAIKLFVHEFAEGVARSTSPDAVKTWKDKAARKRCAKWFLDRERFASLVRQAGRWAEYWKEYVLDEWRPRPDTWYYDEAKRAFSEWKAADERREAERRARIAADNATRPAPVIKEQHDEHSHESAPPSHSGGPADSSQLALVVDGQSAGFKYLFRRIRDFFGARRSGTGDVEIGTLELDQMQNTTER